MKRNIKNADRVCEWCGNGFIAETGPQIYCKRHCQHSSFIKRNGGAGNYIRKIHGMSAWQYYHNKAGNN